ncbi:hypothetical protein H6F67_22025 [Microcoleus sp. FACHB-1515]|uniref:hypothetical protein n=1 Tax=Cyanophyceae TaxID=3028117 RepID=UPI001682AC41|nr:hypothetical protein [Microcoleus sp. FACHB-1515]MBD2092530.1 hypothetical protein [Microcoleus sp. FACHB-1515]
MKESQIEIQAIQAKLQALQMGRTAMRQPTPTEDPPASEAIDWADASPMQIRSSTPPERYRSIKTAIEPRRLSSRETEALLRQLHLPETATLPGEATPRGEALARLEAQIDQIHDLAIAQEAALLELKNLAEAVDRDRKLDPDSDDLPTCEFLAAAVPLIERDRDGVIVISSRPIDLFRAEWEAVSIAKSLRSRQPSRHRRRQPSLGDKLVALLDAPDRPSRQPAPPNLTIADAAIWIIGATVLRVGLDLLLSSFPHLWLPVAGLIVLPAAIAIYRTTFTPETGFTWGYRLFLAMIGLLLGGRFY